MANEIVNWVDSYKLSKPIVVGNTEVSEIKFREVLMGDIKELNLGHLGIEGHTKLFGKISDQPSIVFERLPFKDGAAVMEKQISFLDLGNDGTE